MGCSPWGRKEWDTTKQLNNGNNNLPSVTTLPGACSPTGSGWVVAVSVPKGLTFLQLYPAGVAFQSPL